jgi:hypothetical protein
MHQIHQTQLFSGQEFLFGKEGIVDLEDGGEIFFGGGDEGEVGGKVLISKGRELVGKMGGG